MAYISDLIQERILKLAVSRLANHQAVLDRLRTEFEAGSQATRRMTDSISPFEWPHLAKSDLEFQQVDKRLLRQLDQWIGSQPEMCVPVQPLPLPPTGAPPAITAAVVDQVQVTAPKIPSVIVHSIKQQPKNAMAARIIEAMDATGSSATSIVFVALREGAALNGDEPFTGVTQDKEGVENSPIGSLEFKNLKNISEWLTPQKLKSRIRSIKKASQKE